MVHIWSIPHTLNRCSDCLVHTPHPQVYRALNLSNGGGFMAAKVLSMQTGVDIRHQLIQMQELQRVRRGE